MTEEEAKTKWCPQARVTRAGTDDATSWNRFVDEGVPIPNGSRCIASACMAWRWDVPDPATYEGRAPGYCGLAGKL